VHILVSIDSLYCLLRSNLMLHDVKEICILSNHLHFSSFVLHLTTHQKKKCPNHYNSYSTLNPSMSETSDLSPLILSYLTNETLLSIPPQIPNHPNTYVYKSLLNAKAILAIKCTKMRRGRSITAVKLGESARIEGDFVGGGMLSTVSMGHFVIK
jgi:hypothetical protein